MVQTDNCPFQTKAGQKEKGNLVTDIVDRSARLSLWTSELNLSCLHSFYKTLVLHLNPRIIFHCPHRYLTQISKECEASVSQESPSTLALQFKLPGLQLKKPKVAQTGPEGTE